MKSRGVILVLVLLLSLSACAPSQNPSQESEVLTLSGLTEEPLELPMTEIRELESITGSANTINSSNEASQKDYAGVKLETVLAHNNLSLEGISSLVVNAGDGYSVEIPQEIIDTREIILAWEIDGAPLEGKDAPLRIVIPEERSLYWVRNVAELVFEQTVQAEITELVFFENLYQNLETTIYTYYGSEDLAVNISQLVGESSKITLVAKDGLTKYENLKEDLSYYVKVQGEDAPIFISPSIPKGMYVKDLVLILEGNRAIVLAASMAENGKVDMQAVFELLAPYIDDSPLTMFITNKQFLGTVEEYTALKYVVTEDGVFLE